MPAISKDKIGKMYEDARVKVGPGKGNTNRPVLDQNGTNCRRKRNGLSKK